MNQHLIFLAVAILLVYVGPATMKDVRQIPDEIEDELASHVGSTPHVPVPGHYSPNITESTCWGRGDVRYHTLDAREFRYNTPPDKLGIMVMPWMGRPWWVVTTQEFFNGGPKTRIDEVYVKCSVEYFAAVLGSTVALWYWDGVTWVLISPPGPPPPPLVFASGDVTVEFFAPRGFTITCHAVPMTVSVARHSVWITLTPKHSAADLGVRGICGDYNGYPQNDYINLEPPILPPWAPLLVPP